LERNRIPVGRPVFKTGEGRQTSLVGSTPTLFRQQQLVHRRECMAEKLGIGSPFPSLTLDLVSGGKLDVPAGLGPKYKVILFYRGHW
jgi:hypothetical protein